MRKTDIEFWALRIIDRVEKGQPVEDSRVELKADWIEPSKAARRIAGHANAAHGETILWLIGVDEKQGAKGVDYNNFADWFNVVKSQFDGLPPDSISINVPYQGITVVAVIFETDRAPYVVKNPSGGIPQFEVPWRENTSVRSANRAELLRILVPHQRIPLIETLSGKLTARNSVKDGIWRWSLELQLYVASMLNSAIAIPFHKCSGTLELDRYIPPTPLAEIALRPPPLWNGPFGRLAATETSRPQPDSLTIDGTRNELIVQGPGKFQLNASCVTAPCDDDISNTIAIIRVRMQPVDSEHEILVQAALNWNTQETTTDRDEKGRWVIVHV